MKSKKVLILMIGLLLFVMAIPVSGELRPDQVLYVVQNSPELGEVDDHPWGGESPDPGGGGGLYRITPPVTPYNPSVILIDLIRIIILPPNAFDGDNTGENNGILPGEFGDTNQGNNQKGQ